MAKEICISTTPHETRLAILEDEQLAEIYYERENEYTLAGSIYKGRVTRVLPGMQSSFVDLGLERDAFLYVTDFLEEQEDSEEYAEGNASRRESRPHVQQNGDESQASERSERSGADRDRNPDRGGDRDSGRGSDRGRRSAPALPQQPESRESGRAARDRSREQAAAPLREAVPAAQDLEAKGDEESPTGTRRWRGRRGRRRGVRSGLAESGAPQPLLSDSPEGLDEAGAGEFEAAAPFSIAEHGAPGGIADLHASPSRDEQEALYQPRGAEPGRSPEPARGRDAGRESSRDRGGRRTREPYAQASTFDRPSRPANQFSQALESAPASVAPAIVLPGESLSKYGSAPADPLTATAPTASAPKAVGRPVNYVAPKPSTLVELSSEWDGGAVLPGETLSRYRGASAPVATEQPVPHGAAESQEHLEYEAHLEQEGHEEHLEHEAHPEPQTFEAAPAHAEEARITPADAGLDQIDASAEHAHDPVEAAASRTPEDAGQALPEAEHADPMPLAAPELVAEALPSSPEPPPAQVAEPHIEHSAEPPAEHPVDPQLAAETPEYDPQEASASYRVDPTRSSELRIAGPEAEAEPATEPELALGGHEQPTAAYDDHADEVSLAEPAGLFAGAHELFAAAEPVHADPTPLPEFAGELAPYDPPAPVPSEPQAAHALTILHEDGSIETVQTHAPVTAGELIHGDALPGEFDELHAGPPSLVEEPAPARPSEFSRLVDQLQGFAPGSGLLEEEVIDEEEYDFEPMHAHSDEHDQEELEEETLDHDGHHLEPSTLSDAVRDSYLEQRVHQTPESAEAAAVEELEETDAADSTFGFEEIDEDDEDENDAEETSQPGEPQRAARTDDARGGRGREGRSSGRSGGRSGGGRRGAPGRGGRSAQTQDLPIISDLLKQGQEILVQIAKEPIAKKGARITSHIALPGRFLVFMPTVSHVGVSRKIESDEERLRLKRILISEKGDSSGGFIVRTAAEGASEEDLRADLRFLISLWTEVKQRSDAAKAPALIYHDLNLIERILRDQVSSNFSTIWVDSEAEYERIIRFLNRFQPSLVRRVKLYTKETPLFEHFGIQDEISKALKSKVWLKSGGSIVINQTEALVAIDINTGKYVGKTARLEDTIVKTNLDAIPEIVRQIRLRDLGGIIVIDFIDMDERRNRQRVLQALEEELKHDRAPSKVLQFNDFGLVAITRKRVKQSLERTLSVQCEVCTGTGMVKSPVTVCNEIYIEMRKMLKHLDGKDVMLRVHPEVVKQLKAGNGKWINELEEMVSKTIIIKSDPALHPEQFDIH